MPLGETGSATSFWVNDRPVPPDGELPVADVRWVHREFHQALGIPLINGRFFGPDDTENSPLAVIINETAARELWPDGNAVGKMVSMPWGDTLVAEVIGVVGDVRHNGPATETRPKFYWEHRQFNVFNQMTIFARSQGDPAELTTSLRRAASELDPNLPVYNVRTVESNRAEILAQDRFTMFALGIFAAVALLLASVGIYGVMSYTVNEQSREIGIKMALGAAGSAVTRQVLSRGVLLVGVAVTLGLGGALTLSRLMRGMVYGVSTTDPITMVGVTALLVSVALAACYLPARRASRVDPIEALRQE
jgi:putative ABC transport system permease protein